MDIKRVCDLEVGMVFEGYFLIKTRMVKSSNNNKKFLDLTLVDQTGEVNAKLWDCTEKDDQTYVESELVKVRGGVSEWQGKLQVRIDKIRLVADEEGLRIEDFVPSAPEASETMFQEILGYVDSFSNKDLKAISKTILLENKDKLLYYPAAKQNHHSLRGGLLYHILTMLRAGSKLCQVYTHLNKELLFAGIILHDMSKLEEMEASELGIVSDYTVEGQLLGHIIQGIKRIAKVAEQLQVDPEVALLLEHMVLSHHYEAEFGSPKKPMIPEAELLHYLDIIDARMFDMQKALAPVETEGFSEKIWLLDNRKLYKSKLKEE